MSGRPIEVELRIVGLPRIEVTECSLTEALSEVTRAVVEATADDPLDFASSLAQEATLTLRAGDDERSWILRLLAAQFLGDRAGRFRHRVELVAPLGLLSLVRGTRKFRNLRPSAIVARVLGESGIAYDYRGEADPERAYVTQYRETNLAFVRRLLEEGGVFFTCEPDGSILADDTSSRSELVGEASRFELLEAAGALAHGLEGIYGFRFRSRVAPGRATVNDHDWKKPSVDLLHTAWVNENPDLEIYDALAGFREPDEGARLATRRLEALRARAHVAEGRGDVLRFRPARSFGFGEQAGATFAGDYVIAEVTHRIAMSAGDGGASAAPALVYGNEFVAIPRVVPFRPALSTQRPEIEGCHTALVRGPAGAEIHTDEHGRFKAQFHWDREATGTDADSRWIRMTQESATSMTLARVGWEVSVGYIGGDPDRPIGLARQINGVMRPAYPLPFAKNVMTMKTPTSPSSGGYNELRLDDSAEAMGFHVRAERDMTSLVKHDRTEEIGASESHFIGVDLSHAVGHDQSVTIGASATTRVGADATISVSQDRKKMVGGDEKVDIKADGTLNVSSNDSERVGSIRLTIAGGIGPPDLGALVKGLVPNLKSAGLGVAAAAGQTALGSGASAAAGAAGDALKGLIPTPQGVASQLTGGLSQGVSLDAIANLVASGSIQRAATGNLSRSVGAAFVTVAVGNINSEAKIGYRETVGGIKLTIAATGNISQKVTGALVLTVGAAIVRTAGLGISTTASKSSITVGGTVKVSSATGIAIRGDDVTLEASASLLLDGGVSMALAPDGLTLLGDVRIEAGAQIVVVGPFEQIT